MGMGPEERAVALAKAMKTAAANGLSAGDGARLREILDQHWNAFWRGLRGDPSARVEPLTVTFKLEEKMIKARGCVYSPIRTARLATLEPWSRSARCYATCRLCGLVQRQLRLRREDFAW